MYVEVVAALADAGRAAEVVDGDRRDAALGETQRKLLVEAVEAADVRQDHDAGVARLLGQRGEGREAVAVGRSRAPGRSCVDGAALDRRDRRHRVELEAHAASLSQRSPH